jgi:hypothetical protein
MVLPCFRPGLTNLCVAGGKIFLARGIHYCTDFISSALLASLYCETYVNTSDNTEIVYELQLLPNNTTNVTLLHRSGALRSFDRKVFIGAPSRR